MRDIAGPGVRIKFVKRQPLLLRYERTVDCNIPLRAVIHNRMVIERSFGRDRREQFYTQIRIARVQTITDSRLSSAIKLRFVNRTGESYIPIEKEGGSRRIARRQTG